MHYNLLSMILGIGGCSNAGKSTLALEIQNILGADKVCILGQDDFMYPKEELTKIQDHIDWEIPSTLNLEKYLSAISKAQEQYEYVIAEGLFAFHFEELNAIYDLKIFIELNKYDFFDRKILDLRWGKEEEWYIQHIWDSYQKYGKPKNTDDLITLSNSPKEMAKASIQYLKQKENKYVIS